MDIVPESDFLANLTWPELRRSLADFLQPLLRLLPDKRLRHVVLLVVIGILAATSPLILAIARRLVRSSSRLRPLARRLYRFLWNRRFSHHLLLEGLYAIAQREAHRHDPDLLLVGVDGVNLEKPYTEKLEGVCTVYKSTPPGPHGKARLTPGYPAITATVVNLPTMVISYAHWYSYLSDDFISERMEVYRAIQNTRCLFPEERVRFLGDCGLDDQKVFRKVGQAEAEFIFRVGHPERLVEVYNDRLDRWELERLDDLIATVPLSTHLEVAFRHARRVREADIGLGWLKVRLPGGGPILWVVVAHDSTKECDIALITNVPIEGPHDAQTVYTQWRFRPQIEHAYRFLQERGFDVEDIQVRTLERMRRLFILVLLAALFVQFVEANWPRDQVLWLRLLGGKLGLPGDADGLYVLREGIRAVLSTVASVTFAWFHPFPRDDPTCG